MSTSRRQNVYAVGGDWPAPILWYACGVAVMQSRNLNDWLAWRFCGAIHGFDDPLGYFSSSDKMSSQASRIPARLRSDHRHQSPLPLSRPTSHLRKHAREQSMNRLALRDLLVKLQPAPVRRATDHRDLRCSPPARVAARRGVSQVSCSVGGASNTGDDQIRKAVICPKFGRVRIWPGGNSLGSHHSTISQRPPYPVNGLSTAGSICQLVETIRLTADVAYVTAGYNLPT